MILNDITGIYQSITFIFWQKERRCNVWLLVSKRLYSYVLVIKRRVELKEEGESYSYE